MRILTQLKGQIKDMGCGHNLPKNSGVFFFKFHMIMEKWGKQADIIHSVEEANHWLKFDKSLRLNNICIIKSDRMCIC